MTSSPHRAANTARRERLDVLLVQAGLVASRERAQGLIMAGAVQVGGQTCDKPGTRIPVEARLEVRAPEQPFASRGGLKLERAMQAFSVDVRDRVCLDVGASTGGFTDCLLQRGARRVYAVDCGYGQLDWRLRQDERVVVRERVNARYLNAEHVPEEVDFACLDVSFISLEKVLPAVRGRLRPGADVIALVKPQFEAGRQDVGRGGVVRDPAVHQRVLQRMMAGVRALDLEPAGLVASPVRGPAGNIEFLLWTRWMGAPALSEEAATQRIAEVVAAEHAAPLPGPPGCEGLL